jgi:hypothetical protein
VDVKGKEVFLKLGMAITGIDPETVFNALRLANFSAREGDSEVKKQSL